MAQVLGISTLKLHIRLQERERESEKDLMPSVVIYTGYKFQHLIFVIEAGFIYFVLAYF